VATHIDVLHVDDDRQFGDLTRIFLSEIAPTVTVHTETDPEAALETVSERSVDCVVSDYDMPNTTGLHLLEQVRSIDSKLPFILFTGKGSEEIASEAISAGVTDDIQKSRGKEQYSILANRIKNAVAHYRSARDLKTNQDRLSMFIEQSPLGVIEWTPEFKIVRVNETAESIFGYLIQGESPAVYGGRESDTTFHKPRSMLTPGDLP